METAGDCRILQSVYKLELVDHFILHVNKANETDR